MAWEIAARAGPIPNLSVWPLSNFNSVVIQHMDGNERKVDKEGEAANVVQKEYKDWRKIYIHKVRMGNWWTGQPSMFHYEVSFFYQSIFFWITEYLLKGHARGDQVPHGITGLEFDASRLVTGEY